MSVCSASHIHSDCQVHHVHKTENSNFESLLVIIEKITAVGLGVFSAYTNFKLFVPFFIGGILTGIYSHIQNKNVEDITHRTSSCAYGLVEQLTQVKLPPLFSLAANVALTVCHIDHHETVFVPIIGISLGAWAGKVAAYYAQEISCF